MTGSPFAYGQLDWKEFSEALILTGAIAKTDDAPTATDHTQFAFRPGNYVLTTLRRHLSRIHIIST